MRFTAILLPAAVLLLAACGDGGTGTSIPATLTLSPDSLTLQVDQDEALTATYDDPRGPVTPVVAWQSTNTAVATVSGTGTVHGVAPGTAMIIAVARQAADTATVTVVSPASAACGTAGLSLALGEVRTMAAADAGLVCLKGGAGSEYTVVVTDTGSTPASLNVAAAGTRSPVGPPNPDLIPTTSGALLTRGLAPRRTFGYDARLRELGHQLAREHLAAARAGGPRRSLVPGARLDVSVGDAMTFKVDTATESGHGCARPAEMHTGTVVAMGAHSIIVADNANPSGGLTAAQYQQVAGTFDNQIWASDTENFGAPVDIDNNGKVILFYTLAVNQLTKPDSADQGYVGGYFFPGDVFPVGDCSTGNQAEMFYLLAPDPNGEVNNNKFSADLVIQSTEGTVAHEFEHLINTERRIYVNDATDLEDTWLDEGLAHIAEELLFYRVSGLGPRQNIDVAKLRSTDVILNAVNNFQIANLGRTISYLEDTQANGPFELDDDLETRGAIWQFLRYAVDRKNGTDRDSWFALVNSTTTGLANLRTALGIDPGAWLADFTTAQYTDDWGIVGVDARYTFPSWNFRSVLPAINDNVYPLETRPLPDGRTLALKLTNDGGAAYLRVGVGAGGTGSIGITSSSGDAIPSRVTVTVIRTK
jgi:hypothetical protein